MLSESLLSRRAAERAPAPEQPSHGPLVRTLAAPMAVLMCGALVLATPLPSESINAPVTALAAVHVNATAQPDPTLPPAVEEVLKPGHMKQAIECMAAMAMPDEGMHYCKAHSQIPVKFVFTVVVFFVLFLFAPFYIFPEACVAAYAWKTFPAVFVPVLPGISEAPAETQAALKMCLLYLTGAAVLIRLFGILNTEKQQRSSLSSATWSLVITAGFIYGLQHIALHEM